MANEQLQIDIISPSGALFNGMGNMVIVPGDNGDMGILPGHADTIAALRPGVLWFYTGGKLTKKFFLSGGFADINSKKVVILATTAQDVASLDSKDIEKQIKDLDGSLKDEKDMAQKNIIHDKLLVARAALSSLNEKIYS